jgi:hypothetical protein
MLGAQQNLSAQKLQSLGDKISAVLNRSMQVARVYQCGSGGNNPSHFVAETTTGEYIGLKSSSRGGVANGDEKERLIAELASALDAPNVCKVSAITIDEIAALNGRGVNAIEWLEGGTSLDRLPAATANALKNDPSAFLRQYGEWMSFGLLFGTNDKHSGNWVWSAATSSLSMIDNEDSFQSTCGVQHLYLGIDSASSRVLLKQVGHGAGNGVELARGLAAMQQKYHDRSAQLQSILGSSSVATFASSWMRVSAADIAATVFPQLA